MGRYVDDDGAVRDLQKRDYLSKREIITILNDHDELLKRQEECGKTGHVLTCKRGIAMTAWECCARCGKDLRGIT